MEELVEQDELAECLNSIGEQVEDEHSEREVELMFLNQGSVDHIDSRAISSDGGESD